MKFEKRFGDRIKNNPKKGLLLILLLAVILYLFFNAEKILKHFL